MSNRYGEMDTDDTISSLTDKKAEGYTKIILINDYIVAGWLDIRYEPIKFLYNKEEPDTIGINITDKM